MHMYVSHLKDAELKTLIATYDIPLDLRPRLPDSNFRMSILPAGDNTIDKIPTDFNQDHVDRLKAHIVKLRDIPEGVLVRSGLSRVWRNPMCDPVLRRSIQLPPDVSLLNWWLVLHEAARRGMLIPYFDARLVTLLSVIARELLPFCPGCLIPFTISLMRKMMDVKISSQHQGYWDEDSWTLRKELKSQLEHRERQAEEIQGNITSFFHPEFAPLCPSFLKSSEFNRAFAGVLNTAISVGVERGLRMGRTDEEFRGLSQRVTGFIPDAKEKLQINITAITAFS
ncbi:hypothetical protein Tco_1102565 [Tanacetum coccineum]